LFLGIYRLIRRIATELFLQKWTEGKDQADEAPSSPGLPSSAGLPSPLLPLPRLQEFVEMRVAGDAEAFGSQRKALTDKMTAAIATARLRPGSDEDAMNAEERSVVSAVCDCTGYFEWLLFKKCDPLEQYLLYHFACTGFLNYKNVQQIDHLIKEGVLIREDGRLRLFSRAFRAYLRMDVTVDMLDKKVLRKSDWQRFRIPFLILLTVAAAFLFLTRQEAWQRIVALLAALGTALGTVKGLVSGIGGEKEKG
jgi:hypothetical protein